MLLFTYVAWVVLESHNVLSNSNEYTLDTSFTDQLCDSSVRSFEAPSRSSIECTYLCETTLDCTSVIVHKTSETCYGITDDFACIGQPSPLHGAVFYRKASGQMSTPPSVVSATTTPTFDSGNIVKLMSSVADSQMIASSYWSENLQPFYGRLDNSSHWSPNSSEGIDEYIQVDFLRLRYVTSITTQGSCCNQRQWVETYRFLYSMDCVTFTAIKDDAGQDKIFTGNTDDMNYVTNSLVNPVLGRCVRVNPRTCNNWMTVRLGLNGSA